MMFGFAMLWWAGLHILSIFFWVFLLVGLGLLLSRLLLRDHTPGQIWYRPGVPPTQPSAGVTPAQTSAMEILRQRYARGEIDATAFDQMRERLEASLKQEQSQI